MKLLFATLVLLLCAPLAFSQSAKASELQRDGTLFSG